MNKKVVLVAFNGGLICFVHVLLNAMDMDEKGYDVKVVIEGNATKLASELNNPDVPFGKLYLRVKNKGLIYCVCKACAARLDVLKSIREQNIPLKDDMAGHPSMTTWIDDGYRIITF